MRTNFSISKLIIFLLFAQVNSCIAIWEKIHSLSLEDIKKRGKLKVITAYNPGSYFIYKEEKMGFEYELLKLLAKDLELELEITPSKDLKNLPYLLNTKDDDLVAASIVVSKNMSSEVIFTDHLMTTRQVLIQRKESYHPKPKIKNEFINKTLDLIGKTIHVRKDSDYAKRLKTLQDEIGGKIIIKELDTNITTDEMIEKVYRGEIDYTIADEPTAQINQAYFSELDTSLPISFEQKISWVVRRNSPELTVAINDWIGRMKKNGTIDKIHEKYFHMSRRILEKLKEDTPEKKPKSKKAISPFDDIIKENAKIIDWDWRMLAALIYQESHFNPRAKSWAGASGLMQIMPSTGEGYGLKPSELFEPKKNIKAGVKYLQWLEKFWIKIKDKQEKLKFVMASYNAGQGHVLDAIALTKYYGKNPYIWDENVAIYMRSLSDPDFYNKDVVRYGYCRGIEPFNYVKEIQNKYAEYKKTISDER